MEHPGYQKKIHDPILLLEYADKIERAIKKYCPDASAIVIRGYSGAVMGGIVSALSELPLIIVRKEEESAHSWCRVQGVDFDHKYVIIDDLIDSGNTIDQIVNKMTINGYNMSYCAGIFLYEQNKYSCTTDNVVRQGDNIEYHPLNEHGNRSTKYIPVYVVGGDWYNVELK